VIQKRQAAIALLLWLLVFGAFVTLAGVDDFLDTATTISPAEIGVMLAVVSVYLTAMGASLYAIGRSLSLGISLPWSVLFDTTVRLSHNLTPFGQAGGTPIGAAILSRYSGSSYERCFATLSAKEVINFVPSLLIFTVGGTALFLFEGTIPDELRPLFAAFAVFVLTIALFGAAVYRYPERMQRVLKRVVGGINSALERVPLVPSIDPSEIERRVDEFSTALGDVAADRPTIVVAVTLGTVAFVAEGVVLWVAMGAVGAEIPLLLAIFIVPVSLLAGATPLPGGSGGIEGVQVLMVLATTSAASNETITAVIVSRGLVFWTPIALGALTLLLLQVRPPTPEESV
jgi:uncharacterized protein (TIRG00374 family)